MSRNFPYRFCDIRKLMLQSFLTLVIIMWKYQVENSTCFHNRIKVFPIRTLFNRHIIWPMFLFGQSVRGVYYQNAHAKLWQPTQSDSTSNKLINARMRLLNETMLYWKRFTEINEVLHLDETKLWLIIDLIRRDICQQQNDVYQT